MDVRGKQKGGCRCTERWKHFKIRKNWGILNTKVQKGGKGGKQKARAHIDPSAVRVPPTPPPPPVLAAQEGIILGAGA